MRLICLTLALALLSLAFAPAPLPRADRRGADPSAGIGGTWRSGEERVRITPDRMAFLAGDRAEFALRLDRSARPPAFDLGGIDGTASHGVRCRGIYEVRGDVLTICYVVEGQDRPTSFDPKAGHLQVFTRVK